MASQQGRGTAKEQAGRRKKFRRLKGQRQIATGMGRRKPGSATAEFVVRDRRLRRSLGIPRDWTVDQAIHLMIRWSQMEELFNVGFKKFYQIFHHSILQEMHFLG